MGTTASFHHDTTSRMTSEKIEQPTTIELLLENGVAVLVVADQMKTVLANIQANEGDGCHDDLH